MGARLQSKARLRRRWEGFSSIFFTFITHKAVAHFDIFRLVCKYKARRIKSLPVIATFFFVACLVFVFGADFFIMMFKWFFLLLLTQICGFLIGSRSFHCLGSLQKWNKSRCITDQEDRRAGRLDDVSAKPSKSGNLRRDRDVSKFTKARCESMTARCSAD